MTPKSMGNKDGKVDKSSHLLLLFSGNGSQQVRRKAYDVIARLSPRPPAKVDCTKFPNAYGSDYFDRIFVPMNLGISIFKHFHRGTAAVRKEEKNGQKTI